MGSDDEIRDFFEVVDWEIFQYSDTRKKPNPPWRWYRVQMTFVRSPVWLAMTKPQRADFIAVLGAASETGNMIPVDRKWLRFRELSPNILRKLSNVGLVRGFSLPANHPKIKELRHVFSGGTPAQRRGEENSLEEKGDKAMSPFSKFGEGNETTANQGSTPSTDLDSSASSAPNMPITAAITSVTAPCRRGKQNGIDRRSWEHLTELARPIVVQFGICDADELYRVAGQRLDITRKQCPVVIDRLKKEGTI